MFNCDGRIREGCRRLNLSKREEEAINAGRFRITYGERKLKGVHGSYLVFDIIKFSCKS